MTFEFIRIISLFMSYQQTDRRKLIAGKLCADLFWTVHYLCLGAYGGMIPNFVGIFRELIFINRDRKKWANYTLWPIVFILLNWGMGISSFKSPINILPIAASTFVTVSLWSRRPKLTKIISVPVSVVFFIYDLFVGSYVGVVNESIAILSILLYFIKEKGGKTMFSIFSEDFRTQKEHVIVENQNIGEFSKIIPAEISDEAKCKGEMFAQEIEDSFVSDFEKSGRLLKEGKVRECDLMAHVSTFTVINDVIYMTYYANTKEPSEDPNNQTARLVYCPVNDLESKTFIDIQTAGDMCDGRKVNMVYDTILMQKDKNTLYIMWTANIEGNYYRLYCPFTISTRKLGKIRVNRFKAGKVINDFSTSGIQSALSENGINFKKMYSDIGIMQKLSKRTENGDEFYYTGAYSGDFTCIIKSRDLVTWEYVSEPDFPNDSIWENATYVIGDKCYYFVRQHDESKYGFLTVYDLVNKKWETPVLVEDCQSRADFIVYKGGLYLFHAPIDREHIGIIRVDTENIADSIVVLQAHMHTSCFYPFVQYFGGEELAMSYTIDRKHIRLAKFKLSKYI
ncbi:MAG: YgjV family protein [Monoglobaceae bacterium]